MATACAAEIALTFTGDDPGVKVFDSGQNATSPAQDQFVNLSSGANTFAVPAAAAPTRVTIIMPSGNAVLVTLKGVVGDTGVPLHKTDPTSVALDSTATQIVLNAANTVNGVRIIWS